MNRERMYQIVRLPHVSEKTARLAGRLEPVRVRSRARRRQAGNSSGDRRPVRRQRQRCTRRQRQGQGEELPDASGPPEELEKGLCSRSGRPVDRAIERRLRISREYNHGNCQGKTNISGPPRRRDRSSRPPVEGQAAGGADRSEEVDRRAQQQRPDHHPSSGWWSQAALSHRRFQARQGRHQGHGGADRIRSEPQRAHRADQVHRRRVALHPGAARPARR